MKSGCEAFVHTAHRVRIRAIGLQVRQRSQGLLQIAGERCRRLPSRARSPGHEASTTNHEADSNEAADGQDSPDTPIGSVEEDEHADQKEAATQNLNDKAGEEVG